MSTRKESKMIHVRLSDETHKRLKIKTANLGTTIQEYVAKLIKANLEKSN